LAAHFKMQLKNQEVTESGTATLLCELTKAVDSVAWMKDEKVLKPSDKYRMRREEELKSKEVTEGESTTLQCKLNKAAPVEWYKGPRALKSDGKYQLKQEGPCAELVIQDLDVTDSGDYMCKCGGQQTTARLTINALPVLFIKPLKDEEATEGKTATLQCELNKTSAPIEWRKGHKTLKSGSKYKMKCDGGVAELVIRNLELTDSGNYSCISGEQQTMATLEVKALPVRFQEELTSQEVLEGTAAVLRCALSKAAPVAWRKETQTLHPSAKYKIRQRENVAELTIQDVIEQDAGEYSCVCGDQTTSAAITVQALPPRFNVELKNLEAAEDGAATLRCELTKATAPVEWWKGSEVLKPSDKYEMKLEGVVAELVVHGLQLADTGDYSCTVGDSKTSAFLRVNAIPALFKKGLEAKEASEGGTVVFQCELTKAASVEWRKKHKTLRANDKYNIRQEGPVSECAILNLELRDAGEYSCVCGDQKTTAALAVHALPPQFKLELKDVGATENGTATLHCELTKTAPVEWMKEENKLKGGDKYQLRQEGAVAELVIHDLDVEDAGCYTCKCGDQKTSAVLTVNALKPEFTQQLKNEKAEEGGTARLRCEVTVAKAPVEWHKGGITLHASPKYEMRQDGGIRDLLIHNLEPKDSGEYSCSTGDQTTSAVLSVKELDITILRELKNVEVFEEEDVTFECKVSHDNARDSLSQLDITIIRELKNVEVFEEEDVTFECKVSHDNARDVEWKLQDLPLQSNEVNEISVEKGRVHKLMLRKVTQQDSGMITFRVGPYTSTAQLKVKAPLPVFKQELTNIELQEGNTAFLKCELSQPNISVIWKKGSEIIAPSSKYEISQEGTIHILKIYHVNPMDSGKYICDIGHQKSTATLSVE
ncbi:obscurin-like, partial [Python bivittatus]|uniref:Obscurin-like n=1 Tax=Python bivittatus TaxID=176946 RepID=A0A9F5N7B2_PYTBI